MGVNFFSLINLEFKTDKTWDPETCTKVEESNACGKLRFGEFGKSAHVKE